MITSPRIHVNDDLSTSLLQTPALRDLSLLLSLTSLPLHRSGLPVQAHVGGGQNNLLHCESRHCSHLRDVPEMSFSMNESTSLTQAHMRRHTHTLTHIHTLVHVLTHVRTNVRGVVTMKRAELYHQRFRSSLLP